MEIQKLKDIPKNLVSSLDELEDHEFADSTNRLFPLNNVSNIESSIELCEEGLKLYNNQEQIYLLGQIIEAAKHEGVSIEPLENLSNKIKDSPKGGTQMNDKIDISSPEFLEAVEKAVNAKLKENKLFKEKEALAEELKEIKEQVAKVNKDMEKLTEVNETLKAEKESIVAEHENEKKAEARYTELIEAEIKFKETESQVKEYLKTFDDKGFQNFKTVLTDVAKASQIEKKNDKDNDKDNPKGDLAKGSKKVANDPLKKEDKKKPEDVIDKVVERFKIL